MIHHPAKGAAEGAKGTAMIAAKRPSRARPCLCLVCLPVSLALLAAIFALFAEGSALAADFFVSTTGSDSSPGTQSSPFATLTKAISAAGPGDRVLIGGGTYYPSGGFTFPKSGTSDANRIKYWAVPGEKPVFDFSRAKSGGLGFNVTGSWLHFKGLELCSPSGTLAMNAIGINDASNDIMEMMNLHHFQGTGIFISHGRGGHLLLNCDAHDNYDPNSSQGDGQNADGFGVHYQANGDGTSTTIRGCRAWWNSDDGYDFINHEVPVTIEKSWAFGNGYANYGTTKPADGNGNGFKIGSSKTGIRHLVQNNVAWGNKAAGFYANHSSGGNTWYNNTAFQNGTQFNMLASTWSEPNGGGTRTDGVILTGAAAHIMRNNIAFPNKNSYITDYGVDTQFNTWDLNITPASKDFDSISDSSIGGTGATIETTSAALGPRQADGSLPNVDFLKLAAGSAMIDKGKNVGLPFTGAAPDLGAYEFGAAGTAGASGSGGTTGAGGTGTPGGGGTGGNTIGTSSSGGSSTSMGGRPGTGGLPTGAGTGGEVAGLGGVVASGGSTVGAGSGGRSVGGASTGGAAIGMGGSPASGGAANTIPAGTGGASAATGGTGSGTVPAGASGSSGCSCHLASARTTSGGTAALLGFLMLTLALRRRQASYVKGTSASQHRGSILPTPGPST